MNLSTSNSTLSLLCGAAALSSLAGAQGFDQAGRSNASMAHGMNGAAVSKPLITIGEVISGTTGALNASTAGDYVPVGVFDGLGAYELDAQTVRVFANHELQNNRGYAYEVSDGQGGTFTMTGARVSYIDIDKKKRRIVDAGIAYDTIYDGNGDVASDISFLTGGFAGFSRFCSSVLVEAGTYGLVDTIYFTGEEDGGSFNPVGGAEWALDVASGDLWQLPALGRGAWENVTALDTGDANTVAILLADDSSPFDADGDGADEAAPLFLYVGTKNPGGHFVERNGLTGGSLYVWVSNTGETTPLDFNGGGTLEGSWVAVDNAQNLGQASEDGSTGYDEYGYPTQRNLWTQAEALGAFGFSRPEDVATNPFDGSVAALASTGVDTYAVDGATGNGVDTFGTTYLVATDFSDLSADLVILYDGDADPTRALRSPDNIAWAADGWIYAQEDKAETDTLSGDEVLFGEGAANPNEAGIVRLDPVTGATLRVANIDRDVVLDGSLKNPRKAVDQDVDVAGAWESSGIIDVSTLFGEAPGTLFLFDVQAHGIDDQDEFHMHSRITDGDLVEGGQLLFLEIL